MESNKNGSGYYESLIWLLLTTYDNGVYTPSSFLLDTIKPHLVTSCKDSIPLYILDSTIYDFKIAKGFKDYIDMLKDISIQFNKSLVILSYQNDKYIVRDEFLAAIAKKATCWDTAYIDCPQTITINKHFDFIIHKENLPKGLEDIIWRPIDL